MAAFPRAVLAGVVTLVALQPVPALAQSAGREPGPGQTTPGGTTLVDVENPVTASGRLRLWRAYSSQGGRAMLKVYRPEGNRLVLVGASPLETLPAGEVAVFPCFVPVSRSDLIGVFCPDATCLDRFADGSVLVATGDRGTAGLDAFATGTGSPALAAGTSYSVDIPSTASTNLVLPVAARTPGLADTWWTTRLELFNTATTPTTVALYFNRSGEDNTIPAASAQMVAPPRGALVLDDLVGGAFQLGAATGSVDVVASSPVIAHARVSTPGSDGGSYGQLVPALPARWAVGDDDAPGVNPSSDLVYLFALEETDAFRSNLGVVNVTGAPLEVELQAFVGPQSQGAPLRLALPPFSHRQVNQVLLLLGLPPGSAGIRVNVAAVPGSAGRFLAYASRVDNHTGDAVFLLGSREPALAE